MAAAEEAYKKSLALDPNQKAAAQNLARLHLRQNRAREAIEFFESLRSQAKPTGAIHDALATLFVETGRVEDAIASAKAALKIDEMDTAAMSLLAQAYFLQERHELALLVLGNALAISPGDPVLANQQGVVLLAQGKRQEARTLFQKAADAQSDFPEAQSNLGALLLAAQNFRAAAEHLELALKYAPDFVEARINLASAYRGLGDFAKAKSLYEQALREKPELAPDIEFNLGILHLDARDTGMPLLEQLEKAKAHLNTAQELRGDELTETYLKDADKEIAREKRRLAREERNRLREEKRKAEEAAAQAAAEVEAQAAAQAGEQVAPEAEGSAPQSEASAESGAAPVSEGETAVSDDSRVSGEGVDGAGDGQSGATADATLTEVGNLPGTADEEGQGTPADSAVTEEEAR